jgi:hypothetical protein
MFGVQVINNVISSGSGYVSRNFHCHSCIITYVIELRMKMQFFFYLMMSLITVPV